MGNDATVRFSRLGFEDARLFLAGAPLGLSFFLFLCCQALCSVLGIQNFFLTTPCCSIHLPNFFSFFLVNYPSQADFSVTAWGYSS